MKYLFSFCLFLSVSSCLSEYKREIIAQSAARSQQESPIIEHTRTSGPVLYTVKHGNHLYVVAYLNGAGVIHSPECPCGR
jgi:hypothetical protein